MRPLYFLFPRMKIPSGGHLAQIKFLQLAQQIRGASPIVYDERDPEVAHLDDLLQQDNPSDGIFFVHWGPHVQRLLARLNGRNVVFVSHSADKRIAVQSGVPIIAVSKNTQAFWGTHAPNSLICHLPNVISGHFNNVNSTRDIDVLVQRRKTSRYVLDTLVPALQSRCRVTVLDSWVEDLADIFNRSKVYLYDSSDYWKNAGVSEGFGLPPLEAIACGCEVFSSVNDALSDYLDPEFNCHKLRVYSTSYDVERILETVHTWKNQSTEAIVAPYREEAVKQRFEKILIALETFFSHRQVNPADLPAPIFSSADGAIRPGGNSLVKLARVYMSRVSGKINKKQVG